MERTNANNFRAKLKEWMEIARAEPVKITRKSGEAFILINSEDFEKAQLELATLRGIAQGLNDVVHGRVREATAESTRTAVERAKNRVFGKKLKKASGQ